jgi:hypothetical protein
MDADHRMVIPLLKVGTAVQEEKQRRRAMNRVVEAIEPELMARHMLRPEDDRVRQTDIPERELMDPLLAPGDFDLASCAQCVPCLELWVDCVGRVENSFNSLLRVITGTRGGESETGWSFSRGRGHMCLRGRLIHWENSSCHGSLDLAACAQCACIGLHYVQFGEKQRESKRWGRKKGGERE